MKDLLRISDLAPDDLVHLLSVADEAKAHPHAWKDMLEGDTVVTAYATPSIGTRLAFGSAIARLGGVEQSVGPVGLQLEPGETIEDRAAVVSRSARALVIRTFGDADLQHLAAASTIPVVNARSHLHHPYRVVADLLTLRQRFGPLAGLRVGYVGDGGNVAHSLLEACALAGIDITVATPPRYEPDRRIIDGAERLALSAGSVVRTTHDPYAAVEGANAVCTDAWVRSDTPKAERAKRVRALGPYRVDAALMAMAAPDACFLHGLPAHRGEEVAADVLDGPRSLAYAQAENRMFTAVAVLRCLLFGSLAGTTTRQLVRG